MNIFQRIKAIFLSGVNASVEELEDPRASLDYSLVRLEATRSEVARSLVEVAASRERIADQERQAGDLILKYTDQANTAVRAGRDDLARAAIERREAVGARRDALGENLAGLDQQLNALKSTLVGLDQKITLFRARKEELSAVFDASRAQVRVQEALTGISKDVMDVGHTIRRAEEKIQTLRSRAAAMQGLIDQGILNDALSSGQDEIDRELARLSRSQAIEDELALLKQLPVTGQKMLPDQGQENSTSASEQSGKLEPGG